MNNDVIYPTMVIRSQAETIELQEKEIERLKNGFKSTTEELCEYATRIDKAIEYIKKPTDGEWFTYGKKNLLNILDGDDKE